MINKLKSWSSEFIQKMLEEFENGMAKLIGWIVPLFILTLLWNYAKNEFIDPDLKIDNSSIVSIVDTPLKEHSETEYQNIEKSNGKTIIPTEINITNDYRFNIKFQGKGKISSAKIIYEFEDDSDKDSFITSNLISESKKIDNLEILAQVRYQLPLQNKFGYKYKRVYLVLTDYKSGTSHKYLLLIKEDEKEDEIFIFSEEEISKVAPYTVINEVYEPKTYISNNFLTIQYELSNLGS